MAAGMAEKDQLLNAQKTLAQCIKQQQDLSLFSLQLQAQSDVIVRSLACLKSTLDELSIQLYEFSPTQSQALSMKKNGISPLIINNSDKPDSTKFANGFYHSGLSNTPVDIDVYCKEELNVSKCKPFEIEPERTSVQSRINGIDNKSIAQLKSTKNYNTQQECKPQNDRQLIERGSLHINVNLPTRTIEEISHSLPNHINVIAAATESEFIVVDSGFVTPMVESTQSSSSTNTIIKTMAKLPLEQMKTNTDVSETKLKMDVDSEFFLPVVDDDVKLFSNIPKPQDEINNDLFKVRNLAENTKSDVNTKIITPQKSYLVNSSERRDSSSSQISNSSSLGSSKMPSYRSTPKPHKMSANLQTNSSKNSQSTTEKINEISQTTNDIMNYLPRPQQNLVKKQKINTLEPNGYLNHLERNKQDSTAPIKRLLDPRSAMRANSSVVRLKNPGNTRLSQTHNLVQENSPKFTNSRVPRSLQTLNSAEQKNSKKLQQNKIEFRSFPFQHQNEQINSLTSSNQFSFPSSKTSLQTAKTNSPTLLNSVDSRQPSTPQQTEQRTFSNSTTAQSSLTNKFAPKKNLDILQTSRKRKLVSEEAQDQSPREWTSIKNLFRRYNANSPEGVSLFLKTYGENQISTKGSSEQAQKIVEAIVYCCKNLFTPVVLAKTSDNPDLRTFPVWHPLDFASLSPEIERNYCVFTWILFQTKPNIFSNVIHELSQEIF
ncbi:hypothetical protein HK096_005844, partial [Nowakowskiella sp. JEL0078]